ncbi:hypothetical protein F3K25_21565 [Klebsiella pneumoniae]|uniref:STY1053 family phage-associated protein n=1 Tax=Klebsiella TaxID=570 RepID=UPI001C81ECF6|nr:MULTISPECIES: hypothetical protein [Klebsiella]MBX4768150.1 hypothetical protein [Klebsiella pneumoniae]WPR95584.1 hypothetical protein SM909_09565 [Klebsiella aerogenes]HBZ1464980.1 hypothetical protein [Klebsiella pneumoniae]HCI6490746.1 hypothetical protein [Klebsiella pneumoniae]HDI2064438.1 hypothetical protein [Klebsiella pneumoniae]
MRYLVSKKATLRFADGSSVELVPGIQEYPDEVSSHWAFAHYASPIDYPEQSDAKGKGNAKKQPSTNK